jgi:hypothetical protein
VVVTEWFDTVARTSLPDTGSGPYEGLFVATQTEPGSSFSQTVRMDLSDIPQPSYTYPHVPTLFADRWASSPYQGTLYLTYMGQMGKRGSVERAMFLKVSEDGGRSFGQAKELPGTRGWSPNSDAVIAPNGGMHMVWSRDSTKVFHAVSKDAGRTFSNPTPIATDPEAVDHWPHLAIGTSGNNAAVILAALEQSFAVEGETTQNVVVSLISADGQPGPELPLDPTLGPDQQLRLPAPAVTEDALWVLAYRDNETGTEVVLYRSIDGGGSWHESRVLATRDTKDFYPGHFAGLSAAGNRLYASYALPTDDPVRPVGLYISVIEVR